MKKFLVVFNCQEFSENHQLWMRLSPEQQQDRVTAGVAAVDLWMKKYGSKISFIGGSLGSQSIVVDSRGVSSVPSKMFLL